MAKSGVITQEDIITNEALNVGVEYANNMKLALAANKALVKSVKELNDLVVAFQKAKTQDEFVALKQQQALAAKDAINAIKQQEAAQIAMNNVTKSALALADAQRRSEAQAVESQNRLTNAREKNRQKTAEEIVNQSILARNAKNQAILNSKLSTEYEKLTVRQKLAGTALQNILIIGKKADETQNQYNQRLRVAQNEFDQLNRSVIQANRAIGRFNDQVGNYPTEAGKQIKDLMGAFGVVVGIDLFATSIKAALEVVINFEAEMVNLAAVAGYSRAEISPLEKDIREVAKASINSATDVAQLATELVKLGSTPEEVSKLLKPVNDLSIALQASAEDSATLVKSLLNAYQEGAENATHFTDVLAESANRSALDFAGLRDAFSYVAPVANTLGISVERTAALLGVLADNGIKAESAGRLLSTGLGKVAGQGLTLEQAIGKINKAQKENKSNLEVLTVANDLFGKEAGKLALILANNTQKIDDSTVAYENSAGALSELTERQLKSVSSELKILSSAWEEYILSTNDAANGTKIMTTTLSFLSSNLSTIADVLFTGVGIWGLYKTSIALAKAQTYLMTLATSVNTAATTVSTVAVAADTVATDANTAALLVQIEGVNATTVAQTANATATNVATTATERFNAVLKANALFLVIGALLTVIYLYNKFTSSLSENYDEVKKNTDAFLKNKETLSKNSVSITDLSNRYDVLKAKTKLTSDEQKELNKIIETLAKAVPGATSEMDKYGNAIAINTIKTRDFVKAQDEMVKAQNAVKLKENIALLKDLRKEQEYLNVKEGERGVILVEGIGAVVKENGVLKIRSKLFQESRNLSIEEIAIYKTKVFETEKSIATTEAQIRSLRGLTEAQKASNKAQSADLKESKGPRTIAIIDEEIKAQEALISTLSDRSGREGAAVKARIKALNDERDLIYNNNKNQEKDYEKLAKKQLDNAKRVRDAIYNLNQFRLQNSVDVNQALIDDEKTSTDKRIELFYELNQLRNAKNDESLEYELTNNIYEKQELEKLTKAKRELYIKDQTARVQSILDGSLSIEKMTNSEKLILEKFNAEKQKLYLLDSTNKQKLIDEDATKVKNKIDSDVMLQETQINKAIEAENKIFEATNNAEQQSLRKREKAMEAHERKIYEIKKAGAMQSLQIQIDGLQKELDDNDKRVSSDQISSELRKKIEADLQKAKTDLSDISYEQYVDLSNDKVENDKYTAEKILEISQNLNSAIGDLSNALSEGRIQKLDAEIEKNNEYYDNLILLAKNDEKQKDLLEKERKKKNDILEKKKREEQHKQAVYNKVLMIAQLAITTALAIMKGFADGGYVGAAIAAVLGAVQLAAAIATPIPKYKRGREGGKEEIAMINDGVSGSNYVPEVVESRDGTAKIYEGKNRVVKLLEGDKVHPTVDAYKRRNRRQVLNDVNLEAKSMNDFQKTIFVNGDSNEELVKEMRLTRKAIERNKPKSQQPQKTQDINHAIWRLNNIS